MHFAPDTQASLEFTEALANTVAGATKSGLDELSSVDAFAALLEEWDYSGRIDHDEAELAAARDTRARLRHLWLLPRDAAVEEVNAMLRDANALPHLVRHDGSDWHLHATSPEAPLDERIRVEVALAFVDVIRTDEMGRLRSCEAPDCDGMLLDVSRNGSKQFCSVRCGNRMNMVAFRARADRAAAPDDTALADGRGTQPTLGEHA